ncbi:adenosine deaminase [Aquihabitans sp. G128]|uniref:adenosine deaminase n=1 Tax=Aquihabitans sp. G128 TaxID=2849779 RepID=UPI001C2510CD|nr:adenosine deaminase [Aquihabitans sp. G128]QXC60212.1 adenosine deaminase [Aquihabitans sp. G128]
MTATLPSRPTTLAGALELLPKVELHCHVEGAIRPTTVMELAAKNGIALPADDPTELYRYESLNGFLEVFFLVQGVLADQGDWARIAYEAAVDGAAHGMVYRESFFTPARLMAKGQGLGAIIAGLDEGCAAAEAETGVVVNLICDFDREFGPEVALATAEELVALKRAGAPGIERVLGVGYDSIEIGQEPGWYAAAFRTAGAGGLRRTAHQGENSGPDAILACVDLLGAERIDHGMSILEDPDVVSRFVDDRIALTVCPNSNIRIANAFPELAQHVYPAMREAGILATLNTDDPALTDLDLGYEYASAAEAFGYGWDEMVDIALDGVEACWLEDADKAGVRARVADAREALRPDLG